MKTHHTLIGTLVVLALALAWTAAPVRADEKAPAPEAKPQTKCPIMGGKINKAQFVDAEGYRIYACCPMCLPKIKADPKAAIAKIRANGEEPVTIPEPAPEKK